MEFSNLHFTSIKSEDMKSGNYDTLESNFASDAFANIFSNFNNSKSTLVEQKNISRNYVLTKNDFFSEEGKSLVSPNQVSEQKIDSKLHMRQSHQYFDSSLIIKRKYTNRLDLQKEAEIPAIGRLWQHMDEIVEQETISKNNRATEAVMSMDGNKEKNPAGGIIKHNNLQESDIFVKNIFDSSFDDSYLYVNKSSKKSSVDGYNNLYSLESSHSTKLSYDYNDGQENPVLFTKNFLKGENFLNDVIRKKEIDDVNLGNIQKEDFACTENIDQTTLQSLNLYGIESGHDNNLILSDDIEILPIEKNINAVNNNDGIGEKKINQNSVYIDKSIMSSQSPFFDNSQETSSIALPNGETRIQEKLSMPVFVSLDEEKPRNVEGIRVGLLKEAESENREEQIDKTHWTQHIIKNENGDTVAQPSINNKQNVFDGNDHTLLEKKGILFQKKTDLVEKTTKMAGHYKGGDKNNLARTEHSTDIKEKTASTSKNQDITNGFERTGKIKTDQFQFEIIRNNSHESGQKQGMEKTNHDGNENGIEKNNFSDDKKNEGLLFEEKILDKETVKNTEKEQYININNFKNKNSIEDDNGHSVRNSGNNITNADGIDKIADGSRLNKDIIPFHDKKVSDNEDFTPIKQSGDQQHETVLAKSNEKKYNVYGNHKISNGLEGKAFDKDSYEVRDNPKISEPINKFEEKIEADNVEDQIKSEGSEKENKKETTNLSSKNEKIATTSDQTSEKAFSFISIQDDTLDLEDDSFTVNVGEGSNQEVGEKIEISEDGKNTRPLEEKSVIDQVIKKAVLELKNGRSEIKIEIKPEHLGALKIKVTNDHQHVVAKIFAETRHVKEILEHNLNQLKSDLVQSGIHVDEIDVSVDQEQSSYHAGHQEEKWGKARFVQQLNRENFGSQQHENKEFRKHKGKTESGVDYYA